MSALKSVLELEDIDAATRPAHLVLAEDDAELRQLLASALRNDGYEIITARDGDELAGHLGSLCLRHEFPDLIITDVRMPGASGLEVLESLRETQWTTPVIVITSFGDDAVHRQAELLGAARVFDKPFDVDELRTCVRDLLRRASS